MLVQLSYDKNKYRKQDGCILKKKNIIFLLTAIVLLTLQIFPALATKISYEQKHRGYVTAIEITEALAPFERAQARKVVAAYKKSGVNTAIVHESAGGDFDAPLLALAKEAGMQTAVAVYSGDEKSPAYTRNLRNTIEDCGVQYLLLKESKEAQTHEAPLLQLITNYNLTLVLQENENQLSNATPPGFYKYMAAANGRVMRAYETPYTAENKLFPKAYVPNALYHKMRNSALDRNTEFLVIHPWTDAGATPEENAKATQEAITKFSAFMQKRGYTEGFAGTLAGYYTNLSGIRAAAAALSMLMLLFMLRVLFKSLPAYADWILYGFAALLYGLTYVLPQWVTDVYPTLFAPLGACFSLTVVYVCAQKLKAHLPDVAYIPCLLLMALAALLLCCAVLSAMLSGMYYYLNISIFRGVVLTLLLPLLYAALLLYCTSQNCTFCPSALKSRLRDIFKEAKAKHYGFAIIVLLLTAVYLLRSGNTPIFPAEVKLRNLVSSLSLVRPRTKEFLIGWPALALLLYVYKYRPESKKKGWLMLLASVLFSSVMNTFCHVFADTTVSLLRTVNGLAFSIPFILLLFAEKYVKNAIFRDKV